MTKLQACGLLGCHKLSIFLTLAVSLCPGVGSVNSKTQSLKSVPQIYLYHYHSCFTLQFLDTFYWTCSHVFLRDSFIYLDNLTVFWTRPNLPMPPDGLLCPKFLFICPWKWSLKGALQKLLQRTPLAHVTRVLEEFIWSVHSRWNRKPITSHYDENRPVYIP